MHQKNVFLKSNDPVWDEVTKKFVATIKRLENKIEIDRTTLLSYKREQQMHNLKLVNNNKKLREEKQMFRSVCTFAIKCGVPVSTNLINEILTDDEVIKPSSILATAADANIAVLISNAAAGSRRCGRHILNIQQIQAGPHQQ